MNTVKDRIEEIRKHGYDLDFSIIINKSFENYKRIALNAGFVILLFSIALLAFVGGIAGAIYGFSSFAETMTGFKPGNLSGIAIVIYVLVVVIITALLSPFTAGIIKMAHHAANNQEFSVATAFEYYRSCYFQQIVAATIVLTLFSGGISTLFQSAGLQFIGTIISFFLSFFTFLTIPLIIFGNLTAIEAIKGSFIIVSRQIFVLLGLLIVAAIMVAVGIFGFCIGIFFTIPFLYSSYYIIYREIIGSDQKSEIDQIGLNID